MGNTQGSYELGSKRLVADKNDGDSSLGMENCAIPASRITASSSTDEGPAFFARLNGSKSWCAGSPADCFLEVDLDNAHFVSAVATQGNPIGNHDYVKKYKIQYSIDGMDWEFYKENYKEVLDGNHDYNTASKRNIEPQIKARYVRFWPTAWFQWPCLRVEIYGRPAPPEKSTGNGVVTNKLSVVDVQRKEEENKILIHKEDPQHGTTTEHRGANIYQNEIDQSDEEKEVNMEFLDNVQDVTEENQETNLTRKYSEKKGNDNESQSEEEKGNENESQSEEEKGNENESQSEEEKGNENENENENESDSEEKLVTDEVASMELLNDSSEMFTKDEQVTRHFEETLSEEKIYRIDEEEEESEENIILNTNEVTEDGQQPTPKSFEDINSHNENEFLTDVLNENSSNTNSEVNSQENDVKMTTDDISFRTLYTSTPVKPRRVDVNKPVHEDNSEVLTIKYNDANLKRLMEVKARLELEANARSSYEGVESRKKKKMLKRVTVENGPPEYLHIPRKVYDAMWGDSPTNSFSEGLDNQDEKPKIEVQDGGAPLAKHEDDHIEETSDHQTPQAVTIRTVKTITTRIERHIGYNHVHDKETHVHDTREHDHKDSDIICSTSTQVSHDAPADNFFPLNGFYTPTPYAARDSCEHLHSPNPVVQAAMESSFNERVDSMDQINIDALASRRFSSLDILQSPYDAVSGEDIQRLLAWEDGTLPGWTRFRKSRDYELFKGRAVDGGPPIIKAVITLKKIAYEEAVRCITDWKIRQEWDKTFDKITLIEESYNFNVLHCSSRNQGLTLAVMDDIDIDEPYHASVWSTADHPDSYSLSNGKPLRYDTMLSGLVIRPTQDGFQSSRVTLLVQLKGSVSNSLKGTYLTCNPDRWIDMLKKYSSPKKDSKKKVKR